MYYLSRTNPSGREYWLDKNGKWVNRDDAVQDDVEIKSWKKKGSAINAARRMNAANGSLYNIVVMSPSHLRSI